NILDPGAGDEFSTAIRIGGVQWLAAANLSDPVNSWALKFETSIPNPWNGGTLSIKSSNSDYRARFEPWQVSTNSTVPYSTNGWKTVTIPLSSFRKNDPALGEGKGLPVTSITTLVGNTGTSDLILYIHNYGSSATQTNFNGAFDNFRVVKR
ncbi:MAG: glycan-binding surface protein, partial [Chitinophagaceae bacterium]